MKFELLNYKNLIWYVIQETDKDRLLFLKDSLTNEQVAKYFIHQEMVGNGNCVKFNNDRLNIWWQYSYIRSILNTTFLNDLDINDLKPMSTTLKIKMIGSLVGWDGLEELIKTQTTTDFVRLITGEEVNRLLKLNKEILKTNTQQSFWTMTPTNKGILKVGGLNEPLFPNETYPTSTQTIRPLILLKK